MAKITFQEARSLVEKKILPEEGIAGISIGSEKIKVYVETEEVAKRVPESLGNFPTEVVVSGRFEIIPFLKELGPAKVGIALGGFAVDKKGRIRPCPGGVSIGHVDVTAGTSAGRIYDRATGRRLILSNNHVLANANQGRVGDSILSPGAYDGGRDPADKIALLERFVELRPPPTENLVDAALARPLVDSDLADEVLDIGVVTGMEDATVGMTVAKSGRTTCYKEAVIEDVNATIKVYGYPWDYSIFRDQIITNILGEGGDSGSMVVNKATKRAVGLLFAGSSTHTILNKMTNVASLLNLKFAVAPPPPPPPVLMGVPLILGVLMAGFMGLGLVMGEKYERSV